jgi:hypothetical protein
MMTAFVMIPYKAPFEEIYRSAISRAAGKCGLRSAIVKDEQFIGPIADTIHKLIGEASVCIADLTEANPNVMCEVGIALALKKPLVFITQGDLTSIPFDIRHHRVVKYALGPAGMEQLYGDLVATLAATLEFGGSPMELVRQMLVPSSLSHRDGPYVVAASPLSYREAFRSRGGWRERPLGTYSDHIGIRGLMQAFGSIFGLHRLPELLDPDDFDDKALAVASHLYSIASPKANWLTGSIMSRFFEEKEFTWEFRPDPDSSNLRNPKLMIRLNGEPYRRISRASGGTLVWDYGLIIRGPHPVDPDFMFLIMAGRAARGTEASCLAVTDPECVSKLHKAMKDNEIDPDDHNSAFCAVVSVSAKNGDSRLGPDKSSLRVEDIVRCT